MIKYNPIGSFITFNSFIFKKKSSHIYNNKKTKTNWKEQPMIKLTK